jgi:hypothetical protein
MSCSIGGKLEISHLTKNLTSGQHLKVILNLLCPIEAGEKKSLRNRRQKDKRCAAQAATIVSCQNRQNKSTRKKGKVRSLDELDDAQGRLELDDEQHSDAIDALGRLELDDADAEQLGVGRSFDDEGDEFDHSDVNIFINTFFLRP